MEYSIVEEEVTMVPLASQCTIRTSGLVPLPTKEWFYPRGLLPLALITHPRLMVLVILMMIIYPIGLISSDPHQIPSSPIPA